MPTFVIVLLAQLIDWIVGDPPKWPHPIRLIGQWIQFLTKRLNRGRARVLKGGITAYLTIALVFAVVFTVVYTAYKIDIIFGIFVEILLIAMGLAQKSLKDAAMLVAKPLSTGDLPEARDKLGWIVGRDTGHLDEPEIVRGVVETVSENTSDGVTSPLFYALLFGATGLWVYKAINTLDSMIGYKNEEFEQFGKVSARLDDVANFIPSRITGLFIILFTKNETPHSLGKRIKFWLVDAKKHPSPNSGYLEAATAYQLGIRLGGYNRYGGIQSFRAYMGTPGVELSHIHIHQTIRHMFIVSLLFTVIIGGIFYGIPYAWSELRSTL